MIDHLSLSWSTDEVLSADDVERVTVSNTIIAEPLHWALKHDENCQEKESCPFDLSTTSSDWKTGHGFCQRWSASKKISILGSLFANCYERGLQMNSDGEFDTKLLLANSVFYDYYQHATTWNDNDNEGSKDAQILFFNNYLVGPQTFSDGHRFPFDPAGYENNSSDDPLDIEKPKDGSKVELWLEGNFEQGGRQDCALLKSKRLDDVDCREDKRDLPGFFHDKDPITLLSAYASQWNLAEYLENVGRRGDSGQLDEIDQEIVTAVQLGLNRRMLNTEYPRTLTRSWEGHDLGCEPNGSSYPASIDADCDGIPNAWEHARGLDPFDHRDGPADHDGDGYTNFEEWIFDHAPF